MERDRNCRGSRDHSESIGFALGFVLVVRYQVFETEIGSVVTIVSGPRSVQGSIGLDLVSFSRFFREGNEIELEM